MTDPWADQCAPTLAQMHALALKAFERLPAPFREMCGALVIHVADFAEDAILDDLGIDNPFELTGLYEGIDLVTRSMSDVAPPPAHVHLYRQPILAEWIGLGDVTLAEIITHVLVHEIGHHFGLSDEAMHAIEDAAG